MREENICSVDPPGCTDIDDALHAKDLPNGNFEVRRKLRMCLHSFIFIRMEPTPGFPQSWKILESLGEKKLSWKVMETEENK